MKLFLVEGDYEPGLFPHKKHYVVAETERKAIKEFKEIFDRFEVYGCEEIEEGAEEIVRNEGLIVFCREKWDGE